ncbi:transposase [Desulfobulbus rhabdoformis]|uniref:transposase n=1 Tax=Desulfobulbus rhabdoformis TaxID=34032 RepID=UPI0019653143|nr:transposase [Desulfobulbus rhabdoformis]MBM9617058.1 transposase [Desulfobulbus rhabdoformis]
MSNQISSTVKTRKRDIARMEKITVRKHLNSDALIATMKKGFDAIQDHRPGNVQHSLGDTCMAGFAMFSLKDPSLLAFDERRKKGPHNLMTIYGMGTIPCDTSMREILDDVDPNDLRPLFKDAFRQLQRGKILEQMVFMQDSYLLNLDGTGYFSSSKLYSDACMEKIHKNGKRTYYLQVVGAAFVHPNFKEVIPLSPEAIRKQDGQTKMDCERNAIKRFLKKFRQDHPHLKVIINEDALSSNAPHIDDLEQYACHYILGVKEGDHKFLFQHVDRAAEAGEAIELVIADKVKEELLHYFRIVYDAPLNKSNQERRVTFVEYWEENTKTGKIQRFSWVTDLDVTEDNVYLFMRGARARWKIENETFNTLKNQGYNFGHNYGLGKKYLSEVFIMLTMLAFLIDQILQLCCPLFNAAWKEWKSKRSLWEKVRSKFHEFSIQTMEELYRSLLEHKQVPLSR